MIVNQYLLVFCRIFTGSVLTSFICIGLIAIDPWIAVVSTVIVGGIFALVYRTIRVHLQKLGESRVTEGALAVRP